MKSIIYNLLLITSSFIYIRGWVYVFIFPLEELTLMKFHKWLTKPPLMTAPVLVTEMNRGWQENRLRVEYKRQKWDFYEK